MSRRRIQNEVATSRLTLPVCCLVAAILWLTVLVNSTTTGIDGSKVFAYLPTWVTDTIIGKVVMLLVNYLNVYLLMELNNRSNLIRLRTHFTSSVFILLLSCCAFMHSVQPYPIVVCLLLLFYHCMFPNYQQFNPVGMVFNAFLLIGICLIIFPPTILLIPFLLFIMFQLQCLSIRTILAMIIALATPLWFYVPYEFVFGDITQWTNKIMVLWVKPQFDYSHIMLYQWVCLGVVLLELAISWVHYVNNIFQDKIRTRAYFSIMMFQVLVAMLLMAFYPQYFNVWFAVLIFNASPMISHHFALNASKFGVYVFYISLLILLLMATFNIWMPLLNSL